MLQPQKNSMFTTHNKVPTTPKNQNSNVILNIIILFRTRIARKARIARKLNSTTTGNNSNNNQQSSVELPNEPEEIIESVVNEEVEEESKPIPLNFVFPFEKLNGDLRRLLSEPDKALSEKELRKNQYLNPLIDIMFHELKDLNILYPSRLEYDLAIRVILQRFPHLMREKNIENCLKSKLKRKFHELRRPLSAIKTVSAKKQKFGRKQSHDKENDNSTELIIHQTDKTPNKETNENVRRNISLNFQSSV